LLSFFGQDEDRSRDAVHEGKRAMDKVRELDLEVRELRKEVKRVQSAFHALWDLTAESMGATEDQLRDKMAEIDEREADGVNLLAPELVSCPSCNRKVLLDRKTCIYCGVALRGIKGDA